MIRGAIFDIDGVLLDSMQIWKDLGSRYLKSLNIEPEEGLDEVLYPMSMEQGAEYLKEHYLHKDPKMILEDISGMIEDYYLHEVCAKPGALQILDFLSSQKVRTAAATSSPRKHVEEALKRNGLYTHIGRVFTTGEMDTSKYSPLIYNEASGYLGTVPADTLVFEDSLYALKTAKKAGYITIGVYDPEGERERKEVIITSDAYLDRLDSFFGIWERLN